MKKMREASIPQIARMAECSTPEGDDTDGAKFLRECFNMAEELSLELRDFRNEDYDMRIDDLADEFADGLVPIYTNELWNVWVDCGGYRFDGTYRDFSSHGDTGDTMNRIAQADCYEWARNVLFNAQVYFRGNRDY
ncbi:MAG: hypothetical protein CMI60_06760 [Parvibaculum sp.]|nr:hypothetical protein [Parvibaculum sp.]